MTWQKLSDVTARVTDRLYPEQFSIILQADLSNAVRKEAARTGTVPEVVIAEAVRAYVGAA